jgi:hypothetical protein
MRPAHNEKKIGDETPSFGDAVGASIPAGGSVAVGYSVSLRKSLASGSTF